MNEKINELLEKEIQESKDYIEVLNKRTEFYKNMIEELKKNKPYFFQKQKLKEYNSKLKEYNEKIEKAHTQIGLEEEMIMEIKKSLI